MNEYEKKVARAIRLLQSIPQDGEIEVSYSGGKDSDVILELAKMAGINYRAIYKNTTIDPPGTIKHCRDKGVEILQPKESFFHLVERKGIPTRRARFCCSELKEYKVLDRAIQGIRRSESIKRRDRYKEPEICRVYGKNEKVKVYLPILDWTDADVARFIFERNIQCHPLYYDEQGNFHPERRLGCIGCPMKSDNGKADYKRYPKMLKRLIKAAQAFLDNHPDCSSQKKFSGSAHNLVFQDLFCNSYADYLTKMSVDLWGRQLDTKQFLEQYFEIEL
jgi:phosphoadenosine phosphosulfate reductase